MHKTEARDRICIRLIAFTDSNTISKKFNPANDSEIMSDSRNFECIKPEVNNAPN